MISMSCILGGGLGIVYGVNDIEGLFSISAKLVFLETFHEIWSLMPIGLIVGFCFGFIYGLLRALEMHNMPEESEETGN